MQQVQASTIRAALMSMAPAATAATLSIEPRSERAGLPPSSADSPRGRLLRSSRSGLPPAQPSNPLELAPTRRDTAASAPQQAATSSNAQQATRVVAVSTIPGQPTHSIPYALHTASHHAGAHLPEHRIAWANAAEAPSTPSRSQGVVQRGSDEGSSSCDDDDEDGGGIAISEISAPSPARPAPAPRVPTAPPPTRSAPVPTQAAPRRHGATPTAAHAPSGSRCLPPPPQPANTADDDMGSSASSSLSPGAGRGHRAAGSPHSTSSTPSPPRRGGLPVPAGQTTASSGALSARAAPRSPRNGHVAVPARRLAPPLALQTTNRSTLRSSRAGASTLDQTGGAPGPAVAAHTPRSAVPLARPPPPLSPSPSMSSSGRSRSSSPASSPSPSALQRHSGPRPAVLMAAPDMRASFPRPQPHRGGNNSQNRNNTTAASAAIFQRRAARTRPISVSPSASPSSSPSASPTPEHPARRLPPTRQTHMPQGALHQLVGAAPAAFAANQLLHMPRDGPWPTMPHSHQQQLPQPTQFYQPPYPGYPQANGYPPPPLPPQAPFPPQWLPYAQQSQQQPCRPPAPGYPVVQAPSGYRQGCRPDAYYPVAPPPSEPTVAFVHFSSNAPDTHASIQQHQRMPQTATGIGRPARGLVRGQATSPPPTAAASTARGASTAPTGGQPPPRLQHSPRGVDMIAPPSPQHQRAQPPPPASVQAGSPSGTSPRSLPTAEHSGAIPAATTTTAIMPPPSRDGPAAGLRTSSTLSTSAAATVASPPPLNASSASLPRIASPPTPGAPTPPAMPPSRRAPGATAPVAAANSASAAPPLSAPTPPPPPTLLPSPPPSAALAPDQRGAATALPTAPSGSPLLPAIAARIAAGLPLESPTALSPAPSPRGGGGTGGAGGAGGDSGGSISAAAPTDSKAPLPPPVSARRAAAPGPPATSLPASSTTSPPLLPGVTVTSVNPWDSVPVGRSHAVLPPEFLPASSGPLHAGATSATAATTAATTASTGTSRSIVSVGVLEASLGTAGLRRGEQSSGDGDSATASSAGAGHDQESRGRSGSGSGSGSAAGEGDGGSGAEVDGNGSSSSGSGGAVQDLPRVGEHSASTRAGPNLAGMTGNNGARVGRPTAQAQPAPPAPVVPAASPSTTGTVLRATAREGATSSPAPVPSPAGRSPVPPLVLPADAFATEPIQRVSCPHCGRSFATDRIDKHVAACQKASSAPKRAAFAVAHEYGVVTAGGGSASGEGTGSVVRIIPDAATLRAQAAKRAQLVRASAERPPQASPQAALAAVAPKVNSYRNGAARSPDVTASPAGGVGMVPTTSGRLPLPSGRGKPSAAKPRAAPPATGGRGGAVVGRGRSGTARGGRGGARRAGSVPPAAAAAAATAAVFDGDATGDAFSDDAVADETAPVLSAAGVRKLASLLPPDDVAAGGGVNRFGFNRQRHLRAVAAAAVGSLGGGLGGASGGAVGLSAPASPLIGARVGRTGADEYCRGCGNRYCCTLAKYCCECGLLRATAAVMGAVAASSNSEKTTGMARSMSGLC